ncbi:DnaD domain protein [Companilactobacillus ginsenosidimutans]|uniref:Uncharacterized protein n=1 Tax=Companilactobacillus ginsenosidimutans TaxID=1007676 RepID=A0A0H4QIA1_9LACO|nr:DnaD domain protein [Companilactobacillus ginsenosidimutans]AKP66766.1 hypothetical protein ABM34_03755 [Companilactobacillus ginsenosidimutans]
MSDFNDNKLTPLTGFWCLPNGQFNDQDRQVLTDLYLPLIGPEAFSIYQLLWAKVPNKEMITNRQSHSILFALLDMGVNSFIAGRQRLEALGLIKSFSKSDDMGSFLIYQLFTPSTPKKFFTDDIMSIFLLEKIGESEYSRLADKYYKSADILKNTEDISKKFLEVFRLNDDDLRNRPSLVEEKREDFENSKSDKVPSISVEETSDFDWTLVEDRIGQLFKITHADLLENQQLILSLHEFYGISEVTMIDLIGETTDIVNNKIDPNALKRLAQKRFENKTNITARVAQPEIDPNIKVSNANKPESILLNRAKNTAPADFLADEKAQKDGYVGTTEARALRTLSSRSILPNSVLNIMVHYILQSSPTLALPLMETISNDWKQNGVKTPEDALKRLNDFQNRSKNPRKRRYSKNSGKVEQATDWSKVQSKSANNTDEIKAEQHRQEMLKKLRNRKN